MELNGNIIFGEFDRPSNAFILQKVKHVPTETMLSEKQLLSLYNYLHQHKHDEDGQVITLDDDMPLLLTQKEIDQLLDDLDHIRSLYH
ncbi:MAG TPA: hypothetical protein VK119_07555 [Bacillota bacterium]|nr:hypothetical protein [Bacillota bacterium]